MTSVRTQYLLPACICVLFCAQVVAPVALADNNGFQQAPTAAGAALGEDVTREIVKIIEQKHKELVESITKMMNEKTAALEKSLAEKDKRIADLEKELGRLKKELAAAAKPPAPPKPKPEPKPTNAFLGVGHIDNAAGAMVTTVHPGSPAAVAGMKEDDLIVAVNGKKVNSESLGGAVTLHAPGTTITLEYMRGGKKAKAEVKLVDRDAFFAARSRKDSAEKEPGHIVLGVTVEEDGEGLFAFQVEDGFTGKAAGVQKGDRITGVNGKAVKTLDELESLLKKIRSGQEVALRLVRGEETIDVVVVGSSDKGGAKLVSSKSTKAEAKPVKPAPEKKKDPPPEKKPEPAGFLGVGVGSVEGGLEVEIVVPDSAAAAYGIKVGDVIKQVNGKNTTSIEELRAALGGALAGAGAKVLLRRKGADITLNLVLGARGQKVEAPKSAPAAAPKPAPKPKEKPPEKPEKKSEVKGTLGIHARQTAEGQVVITKVIPGAAAEKAGIKAGDLVLKLGNKEVASLKDLQDGLGPLHAGESINLKIRRGDEEKDVKVTLGEPLSTGDED